MLENGWSSESSYAEPAHDNARRMIQEAIVNHGKDSLKRLIDDRYEKVVAALFQEAQECSIDNCRALIYEVIEQPAVNALFTKAAEGLFD